MSCSLYCRKTGYFNVWKLPARWEIKHAQRWKRYFHVSNNSNTTVQKYSVSSHSRVFNILLNWKYSISIRIHFTVATLLSTPVQSNAIKYNSSAINSTFTMMIYLSEMWYDMIIDIMSEPIIVSCIQLFPACMAHERPQININQIQNSVHIFSINTKSSKNEKNQMFRLLLWHLWLKKTWQNINLILTNGRKRTHFIQTRQEQNKTHQNIL